MTESLIRNISCERKIRFTFIIGYVKKAKIPTKIFVHEYIDKEVFSAGYVPEVTAR